MGKKINQVNINHIDPRDETVSKGNETNSYNEKIKDPYDVTTKCRKRN